MGYRIGLLEDEDLTRLMLAASLEAAGHIVTCQSGAVSEFLELASSHKIEIAVLDLNLGKGPTGLDAAAVLRSRQPEIGLVFLTSFDDPRLVTSGMERLPQDSVYLVKRDVKSIATLSDAIERAIKRGPSVEPSGTLAKLSTIQIEILKLVASGASNTEIAKQRFITERSVETHVYRIAKALGISQVPDKNQRVNMAKAYFRAAGLRLDE